MELFQIGESASLSECSPPLTASWGRTVQGAWAMPTRVGWRYDVEASPNMIPGTWGRVLTLTGDGQPFTFPGRTSANAAREFFRVRIQAP